MVYDGIDIILYENGEESARNPANGDATDGPVVIGANKGEGGGFMDGTIDDLVAANRALTQAEIQQLMMDGVSTTLGIKKVTENDRELRIFQPSVNVLKYQYPQRATGAKIFNMVGQEVLSVAKPEGQLSTAGINNGVYILKLAVNNSYVTRLFIK